MIPPRRTFLVLLALLWTATASASVELAPPRRGPAAGIWNSAVGASPHGFLAVWNRGGYSAIDAAAIDGNGRQLAPFAVGLGSGGFLPIVVAVGDDFLVQVSRSVNHGPPFSEFLRVATDGTPKGAFGASIDLPAYEVLAATPRGDRLLFMPRSWSDRQLLMLDDEGAVIRRFPLPASWQRNLPWSAPVASTDHEFILTWWDESAVRVLRVPTNPADAIPPEITVATGERYNGAIPFGYAAAATDGREIVVAYAARQDDPATAVRFARITAENVIVSSDAVGMHPVWLSPNVAPADVIFVFRRASDHYVMIRRNFESNALSAMRFSAAGAPLDEKPVDVAPPGLATASLANIGDRFYAVGVSQFSAPLGIVGSTFATGGGIHDISFEELSIGPAEQVRPRVATDGVSFMSVWYESDRTSGTLRGAIFTSSGEIHSILDIAPRNAGAPEIAYGGGVYLVVWVSRGSIYAVRVTPSGTILDPSPIVVATGFADQPGIIALASNGSRFLVVWRAADRIETATVSSHGESGPIQVLRSGPAHNLGAQLSLFCCFAASDGDSFLVLWNALEYRSFFPPVDIVDYRLEASIVSADGSLRTPSPMIVARDESTGPVAWNGHAYAYLSSENRQPVLKKLDRQATPIGQIPIFSDVGYPVALTTSGGDYVLAYTRYEESPFVRNFIARISRDGTQRRFAFGRPRSQYNASAPDVGANRAGDIVVVVDEIRPDHLRVESRRVVAYGRSDFVALPGARRRAAGR